MQWLGLILGIVVLAAVGLWLLPTMLGMPWVPTRQQRIEQALALAQVQPGERVYDLGAGDGRVLVTAVRQFHAQAIGVEIAPVHCLVSWLRARLSGVGRQVTVRWGNVYRTNLGDADVVFVYLPAAATADLRAVLAGQLRAGTRVVTVAAEVAGWQPTAVDHNDLIFLYEMPPTPGSLTSYLLETT